MDDEYELGAPLPAEVVEYRRDRLTRAGYSEALAEVLAELPDVDMALALALVERGCPPEQAAMILL